MKIGINSHGKYERERGGTEPYFGTKTMKPFALTFTILASVSVGLRSEEFSSQDSETIMYTVLKGFNRLEVYFLPLSLSQFRILSTSNLPQTYVIYNQVLYLVLKYMRVWSSTDALLAIWAFRCL